jgi:hypothetical protein
MGSGLSRLAEFAVAAHAKFGCRWLGSAKTGIQGIIKLTNLPSGVHPLALIAIGIRREVWSAMSRFQRSACITTLVIKRVEVI